MSASVPVRKKITNPPRESHMKPILRPKDPRFGSGPCRKYPGWELCNFDTLSLSRSHRSAQGFKLIDEMVGLTRKLLNIPHDYKVALVPGSATGAIEMAMWNLLGTRTLTALVHDEFSNRWLKVAQERLKLPGVEVRANFQGQLPDTSNLNPQNDLILNWNGSTSGACYPDLGFLSSDQEGLVICDLASAVFTCKIAWEPIDAAAFSWQKGLGSEGGHGMLALSPRAISHIENNDPAWPVPYLFSLKLGGHFNQNLFSGSTLNTPSLLCLEDFLLALRWANDIGGGPELLKRTKDNLDAIESALEPGGPLSFLVEDKMSRSGSTICIKVNQEDGRSVSWNFVNEMAKLLEEEQVALDIVNHPACPIPSLRIWGGPTMPRADLEALMPWLYWAHRQITERGIK